VKQAVHTKIGKGKGIIQAHTRSYEYTVVWSLFKVNLRLLARREVCQKIIFCAIPLYAQNGAWLHSLSVRARSGFGSQTGVTLFNPEPRASSASKNSLITLMDSPKVPGTLLEAFTLCRAPRLITEERAGVR
jgi:hypothetical protein